MSKRLAGKVAIVTGAAGYLGTSDQSWIGPQRLVQSGDGAEETGAAAGGRWLSRTANATVCPSVFSQGRISSGFS